jgi:hypothetical protein
MTNRYVYTRQPMVLMGLHESGPVLPPEGGPWTLCSIAVTDPALVCAWQRVDFELAEDAGRERQAE